MPNKYHARRVFRDGQWYASIKEARRHSELVLMQRAGEISDLREQVPFELIPAQYEEIPTGKHYARGERKGQEMTKRVCVEKAVVYRADFCYTDKDGTLVVEDAKGVRTPEYIIKRKAMLFIHGIRVREV